MQGKGMRALYMYNGSLISLYDLYVCIVACRLYIYNIYKGTLCYLHVYYSLLMHLAKEINLIHSL